MTKTLPDILRRLDEYSEKAVFEVDIDFQELEDLNIAIQSKDEEMTSEMAVALKKNIDEIDSFVDHQKQVYRKILNGVTTGKKAIGQYKCPTLKTQSMYVYTKA